MPGRAGSGPLPRGSAVVGRLATRGRVPLGYYNDPDRSARTFVEIDGVRWSLPGDMATIDADGTVHLLGRGSLCINTGGEKVYPEEVESVLKEHADVFDAVVVGVPDERFGERVVALVQVKEGHHLDEQELSMWCRRKLAGYKTPRRFLFVDTLQRSAAGKAHHNELRALALELLAADAG